MRAWVTTLAVAAVLSGCSDPAPSSADTPATQGPTADELARQGNERACISRALNDAVLKRQSDVATVAALDAQDLTDCPSDFIQAFVGLRNAVRNYMQTQQEIRTHGLQEDDAVGKDVLLNLPCSLIAGQKCFTSSFDKWQQADAALKQRNSENETSLRQAMANIEQVSAGHGIYIRQPGAPAPGSDDSPAMREDAL